MSLLQKSKPALYTVMNELLDIHGESVQKATLNEQFRGKVDQQVAQLFAPETGSNELLEICQRLLKGYEKGIYKLEDLYEFRDIMVQLRGKVIKGEAQETETLSLHETVGNLLKIGLYGEHVSTAASELRDKNVVAGSTIAAFMAREE